MSVMRILLVALLLVTAVGGVLWVGLDAIMRSVTEMERNRGGARQAVKNDRPALPSVLGIDTEVRAVFVIQPGIVVGCRRSMEGCGS